MKIRLAFGVLIAVVVVVFVAQRQRTKNATPTASPRVTDSPIQATNQYAARKTTPTGAILTDAQDPEFVERVLPVVRKFFATLDRAGVNPLQGELAFNTVELRHGPKGTMCRF